MFKRKQVFLWILILTVMGLCGCGKAVDFFGGDDNQVTYEDSNIVYVPIERVKTLNPATSLDEDTYYISKLVYEGLFALDEALMPQAQLASSYTFDEKRISHIIYLKKGVRWHDGEEFTAADVKFTIDSLINLSYSNETLYGDYVSNIASVKLDKSDDMKCTIYYKNAQNTGVENLIFPILPSHDYKNVSALKAAGEDFQMVGTGPYQCEEFNSLSHVRLVGYSGYSGTVPENILEFQILPETKDAIKLMDVSNISMLFSKDMDRDTLIANKNIGVFNYVSNEAELIGFNFNNAALAKKKVRQALAYAIDAQAILDSAYYKNGVLSDTLYYPGYFGVENTGQAYHFDLNEALSLLTQAGYADIDGDTFFEDKEENEISLKILVNENNSSRMTAAEMVKTALDKLPINTQIESCSWDEYNSRLYSGDYDLYIGGYRFDERYDLRRFLHSGYSNVLRYSNDKLDVLLDEMQVSSSNSEKTKLYQRARDILVDEIPYYCLFYKTYGVFTGEAFRGEPAPMFNNIYKSCQDWSCSYVVENPQ